MFAACHLWVDRDAPLDAAVSAIGRWVDAAGSVRVLARLDALAAPAGIDWAALEARLAGEEARLGAVAAALAPRSAPVEVVLHDEGLTAAPLVVVVSADAERRRGLTERALTAGAVVGWPGADRATRRVLLPVVGDLRAALAAVLAARRLAAGAALTVLALRPAEGGAGWPGADAVAAMVGWEGPLALEVREAPALALGEAAAAAADATAADLVIGMVPSGAVARALTLRAAEGLWAGRACDVVLVPAAPPPPDEGRLWACDAVVRGGSAEARLDRVDGLGRAQAFTGSVVRVVGGRAAERVEVDGGRARWRDDGAAAVAWSPGPVTQATAMSRRLPADAGAVGLFDAADEVAPTDAGGGRAWWAVRLDAAAPAPRLRARHPRCPLVDADTLLGDGHPDDLPEAARGVRLLRCARHLRAAGVPVDAILPPAGAAPLDLGAKPAGDALVELAEAHPDRAERVDLLFDNAAARRALLADIGAARDAVHLQTYIFEPDAIGERVADALRAAGARGVRVRLLVDALYSGHEALGRTNATLAALAAAPGVEVRAAAPVTGVPDLHDLKARDHRKLLIVDGRRAHVTGRNVGAAYYRGFDEVALGADDGWAEVPWLDAGVALEGPVVGAVGRCFVEAWRAAGGEAPEVGRGGAGGSIPVRFVVHRSLEDANALEVYRRLFDEAEREIVVVNTFPLQFELRAALLRARARGVAVRVLVGNVRPLRGDGQPFRGGMIRDLATAVIHGRLDPLVQVGAEAVEYRVPPQPGWSAAVGAVRPHVHAKVVCVDGTRLTVGSANLDITAGYWESEALVLVEHPPTAAHARRTIDGWLRGGLKHDPGDPAWQARAARRGWLAQNWPSVLG